MTTDFETELFCALTDASQPYDGTIIYGQFIRYGGKSKPCWLIAHQLSSGHIAASFGDWREGTHHEFKSWLNGDNQPHNGIDAAAIQRELEQRRKEAEAKASKKSAYAKRQAQSMIDHAPMVGESEYLKLKKVSAHGVHFSADYSGKFIAVPMRDIATGELKSVQRIYANGDKKFLSGTPLKNNALAHLIGAELTAITDDAVIWITEGYATGATVHEIADQPVFVAFDSGNLPRVAKAVRERYPNNQINIAADNDQWGDADNTGLKAAQKAAEVDATIFIPNFTNLITDEQKPTDFNDLYLLAGADTTRRQLEQANTATAETEQPSSTNEKAPNQATVLVELAESQKAFLFHDAEETGYASIPVNGHIEHHKIRSKGFKRWLTQFFYRQHGRIPSTQALQDAVNALEGKAIMDGPTKKVFIRTAEHNGRLYYDLCNDQWEVVEIDANGWRIVSRVDVVFVRKSGMQPSPFPVKSKEGITKLWDFCNFRDDHARILLAAWLLAALRPRGPFPVLALTGEQGSSKSTIARLIRLLVDPHIMPLRSFPKDESDLAVAAANSAVLILDNLSWLPPWGSDALCRLSTGGGLGKRKLYTDDEETYITVARPLALTSIVDVASQFDLLDRCLIVNLEPISEDARRTEEELYTRFEAVRPAILGGLFDAVSVALRRYPEINPPQVTRMADFAYWALAGEPALGVTTPDCFLNAYNTARSDAIEAGLESSLVYTALKKFKDSRHGMPWEGTATELRSTLIGYLEEEAQRYFPKTPRSLSSEISRINPALRKTGLAITKKKVNGKPIFCLDWGKQEEWVGQTRTPCTPCTPDKKNNRENSYNYDHAEGGGQRTPYVYPEPSNVHPESDNVHPRVHKVYVAKNNVHPKEAVNHAASEHSGIQGVRCDPTHSSDPCENIPSNDDVTI